MGNCCRSLAAVAREDVKSSNYSDHDHGRKDKSGAGVGAGKKTVTVLTEVSKESIEEKYLCIDRSSRELLAWNPADCVSLALSRALFSWSKPLLGFVDDQFGLGLIARVVVEGIAVIKPMGIMIFNMGGHPGQGVCKRLFERRGVCVNKLWQTKILQAGDTDISALVEIEKNSPLRFEFFMGLVGDQPICARTAWAYGKAGGHISHALSVYNCQLRQPNQGNQSV